MSESWIKQTLADQGRYETARANFNTLWQEVAERVDPNTAYFTTESFPGQKKTEKQFDSTATIALGRAVAAFESMMIPRTQTWHNLIQGHGEADNGTRIYLEAFRDLLFKVRYSPRANFANQSSEVIRSWVAYGNGVLYLDDDPGVSLRYRGIHLAECWWDEDQHGRVDRVHRKFKLTARQMVKKFAGSELPAQVTEAADKQPNREFEVLHCCKPNTEREAKRADWRGKPFLGYYMLPQLQSMLEVAGHFTLPYIVARYRVNQREIYGRGPVMDVLAAIKTANEMQKTNLRAGQRIATPPLLSYRDGIMGAVNLRADHVNVGGLDERGTPLIQPMATAANLPVALEMQQEERKVINDNLFLDVFEALRDNPTMTATQSLQLVQERGVLMSPATGRFQTEGVGPMVIREVDLLTHVGGGEWLASQLGPMPDALRMSGGAYEIEYDAPINKAQKAEQGVAILQTLNDAAAMAQYDKRALQIVKIIPALRKLGHIRGMPSDLLATDEEMEAMDEQAAQEAQMAQVLTAAPIVADSANKLAQAEATAQAQPRGLPA